MGQSYLPGEQASKQNCQGCYTNNSRVSLRRPARAGLKVLEPYTGKLARTVLRGRKLPGWVSLKCNPKLYVLYNFSIFA